MDLKSINGLLSVLALFVLGLGLAMWWHQGAADEALDMAAITALNCRSQPALDNARSGPVAMPDSAAIK